MLVLIDTVDMHELSRSDTGIGTQSPDIFEKYYSIYYTQKIDNKYPALIRKPVPLLYNDKMWLYSRTTTNATDHSLVSGFGANN